MSYEVIDVNNFDRESFYQENKEFIDRFQEVLAKASQPPQQDDEDFIIHYTPIDADDDMDRAVEMYGAVVRPVPEGDVSLDDNLIFGATFRELRAMGIAKLGDEHLFPEAVALEKQQKEWVESLLGQSAESFLQENAHVKK